VDWHALGVPAKAERAFRRGVEKLGRNDSASQSIRYFRRAISLYPEYCEAYVQLAVALFQEGELSKALEVLEQVLSICPQNGHALALQGKVLLERGQVTAAIDVLSGAVALDNRIWSAHKDLSEAFTQTGRLPAAHEHAKRAHLLRPASPASHILLYRILASQKDYTQALAELDEIISLFGSRPVVSQVLSERDRLVQFLRKKNATVGEPLNVP
jgi:tetratricopeptide (TPR) repeat protein